MTKEQKKVSDKNIDKEIKSLKLELLILETMLKYPLEDRIDYLRSIENLLTKELKTRKNGKTRKH